MGFEFDDDMIEEFRVEALEQLQSMEDNLLEIQDNGFSSDAMGAIFRAAHTIKGSAGMFNIEFIVSFTHILENLLDEVRNERIGINDDMISLFLNSKDHIERLITFACAKEIPDSQTLSLSKELEDKLKVYLKHDLQTESIKEEKKEEPQSVQEDSKWHISLRLHSNVLKDGMDPKSFILFLASMGEILHLETITSKLAPFNELEPLKFYLGFEIDFKSDIDKDDIIDVFDFVAEDSLIEVLNHSASESEFKELIKKLPEEDEFLFELFKKIGILKEEVKPKELKQEAKQTTSTNEVKIQPKIAKTTSIRVDSYKIDYLINMIGELVIANANVMQQAMELQNSPLVESVSNVSLMIEEIRESAMQIRMVQIGETFNKFKRIIRDVSKDLNKEIELQISGAETELDKTVVEKISDPLIHLVRNAVDHGVEGAQERLAKGKEAKGLVKLEAYHDRGNIVIEISDDGKGLDKDKLIELAIKRGIAEPNREYSEKEAFMFIFEAGFSTAKEVTNISGRGVGMDVVRKNIEALRGVVDIISEVDKGTTFQIRLPLTLAIIDGFLVKVGQTSYVVPLDMVVECLELSKNYKDEMYGNNYINLRGHILPLLPIREFFMEKQSEVKRENIIVAQFANYKVGLVVDELLGEFQTVIKPLGKIFKNLKGISGATILGSGEVALILDVPALIQYVNTKGV